MHHSILYAALPTAVLLTCLIVPSADTVAEPNLGPFNGNNHVPVDAGLTAVNGAAIDANSVGGGTRSNGGLSSESNLAGLPSLASDAVGSTGPKSVIRVAAAGTPYSTSDGPTLQSGSPGGSDTTPGGSQAPAGDFGGSNVPNPAGGLATSAPYSTSGRPAPPSGSPTGSGRTRGGAPTGDAGGSTGLNPAISVAAGGTPYSISDRSALPSVSPGGSGMTSGGGAPSPAGDAGGSNEPNPVGGLAAAGTPNSAIDGSAPQSGSPRASDTTPGGPQAPAGSNEPGPVVGLAAAAPNSTIDGSTPSSGSSTDSGMTPDGSQAGAGNPDDSTGPNHVIALAIAAVAPNSTTAGPRSDAVVQSPRLAYAQPSPSNVPEPSSCLILILGLGMMGGMTWRRRS